MAGHFFCALCERRVVIDPDEVENFRVGVNLFCSRCDEQIKAAIINRIIDDTSVPKTYRKIFERYLKWMEER